MMTHTEKRPFLLFTVHTQTLALPVEEVHRITAATELIPLPEAPSFLRGMINWGGTAVPVVDLRVRLGLPPLPLRSTHRFILVEREGVFLAFLVESVQDVAFLEVEPLPFPREALPLLPENYSFPRIGKEGAENRILCVQNLEDLLRMVSEDLEFAREYLPGEESPAL